MLHPSALVKSLVFSFCTNGLSPAAVKRSKAVQDAITRSGRGPLPENMIVEQARKARWYRLGPASATTLVKLAETDPYVEGVRLHMRDMDSTKLSPSFAFYMTDPIGIKDAIKFGARVSGIDTSWRHFNTAGAPITVLVASDPIQRKTRILALLFSAKDTISAWIRWFQGRLADFCRRIVASDDWPADLESEKERVIAFVNGRVWEPAVMTMDHAESEYNAVARTCPSSVIRACYFHFKQQILRWSFAVDPVEDAANLIPGVEVRKELIAALLPVFESKRDESSAAEEAFVRTEIAQCVDRGSPGLNADVRGQLIKSIQARLKRVWFNDKWRKTIYSHHLPDDIANSEVWTNNW